MRTVIFFCGLFFTFQMGMAQIQKGFVDYEYNEEDGKIALYINHGDLDHEFLYVPSLSAGVGSNDIGLDRGQLGQEKVVYWKKLGNKIFLIQPNMDYRALSQNELERRAVQDAFAQSVLGAFKIESDQHGQYKIDFTPFLIRDAHGVARRLKMAQQGAYKLDKSRSAVWAEGTMQFPDNTEFEVLLTFEGDAKGRYIRSVTPSAQIVTIRQHHSFVRLPDGKYKPRVFHPFSGFNAMAYMDYATPIEAPLTKRWIKRHRLEKRDPNATISVAVEPIIYYLDPGCPEPIKSALMEGARWWDQAFQAAGYEKGTFQVRELPAGAHMMDIRYNVIQWVHRSTRGWSYGATVTDPRTGEILKGHVSLGSLRVRQDFLIAQGILSPYKGGEHESDRMKEMALARLRQLAAHEVGHTIGLAHNFASSTQNRSSVMDYPHPYIVLNRDGTIDLTQAYDTKIGDWDKRTILYGYSDFADDVVEDDALNDIIVESQKEGFRFISDRDARPLGGAHALAHLWDNGSSPVDELDRLMGLRQNALRRMGENSIPEGSPLSELEKVLVPVYLMHRYQVEATAKLIGGMNYQYYVKGDALVHETTPIDINTQGAAIRSILNTLTASQLRLPDHLLSLIAPPAFGYSRDRETFEGRTNLAFDALAPVESYAHTAIGLITHKDRLTRIHRHHATQGHPMSLEEYLNNVADHLFEQSTRDAYSAVIESIVRHTYLMHLLEKTINPSVDPSVAAIVQSTVAYIDRQYLQKDDAQTRRLKYLLDRAQEDPDDISIPKAKDLPPGSPIGCGMSF